MDPILKKYVTQQLKAQQSPEAIAGAIRYLAEHSDMRIIQGRRNRELVARDYSVSNIRDFYDGLCAVGTRNPS